MGFCLFVILYCRSPLIRNTFFFQKGYVVGIFFAVAMLMVVFIFRLALIFVPGTIICKMAITGNAKFYLTIMAKCGRESTPTAYQIHPKSGLQIY